MPRDLTTTVFGGSVPRRAKHLVPANEAAWALDCKLETGELSSWRAPRPIREFSADTRSIYHAFNCCWLSSTTCAHWAEGPVEQRHVFATQYNGIPYPVRLILDANCTPEVVRLGLPCPATRPDTNIGTSTSTKIGNASKGAEPRSYAYQFGDRFGNRSTLSEPSLDIVVAEGTAVQVSGWAVPGGGWDITTIYIFRSVAGYDSAITESDNNIDSGWMQVAAIPAASVSFIDTVLNIDLDEAIKEDIVEPPPADLQGLTWIKSNNCLVGFVGRRLYFTENNNYHNWAYNLLLDDDIKAIAESNNVLYVATNGHPYAVQAAVDCPNAGCRRAIRMPEPVPLVGAGFRSMIALPSGVVWPTHIGLAYMSGDNPPKIATASLYGATQWQALHPDTMKGAYHEGRLFCTFRKGGYIMGLSDGIGIRSDVDTHTELSLRPDEWMVSRTGRLYLRTGAQLSEWDRGDTLMTHTYESGTAELPVPFNFGVLHVRMAAGSESVTLYVDDDVALDEPMVGTDTFPLPSWEGTAFRWRLQGTATVHRLSLAPSYKELT